MQRSKLARSSTTESLRDQKPVESDTIRQIALKKQLRDLSSSDSDNYDFNSSESEQEFQSETDFGQTPKAEKVDFASPDTVKESTLIFRGKTKRNLKAVKTKKLDVIDEEPKVVEAPVLDEK